MTRVQSSSRRSARAFVAALLLSPAGALGCHGGAAAPSADGNAPGAGVLDARQPATTGRYIPLAVGATWAWNGYDTSSGASGVTDSKVEALESITGAKAGISAFRVRSTTLTGSTVNWQQDTGTATIRHREQFLDASGGLLSDHLYSPSKLRLDEDPSRIVLGASWTETFTDEVTAPARSQPTTTITVMWAIEAVDEIVTVPAGTFKCLRVHSIESGAKGYDSTFWFARNVGKVKETGTEIRDLVSYSIP